MQWIKDIWATASANIHDRKNRVALIILFAIIAPIALLSFAHEIKFAIGFKYSSLFGGQDDRFGDILKCAMSYTSITSDLIGSDRVKNWPEIYQNYLTKNPYLGGIISHFHITPLGTIIQIIAAGLLTVIGPLAVLRGYVVLYILLAIILVWVMRRFFKSSPMDQAAALVILLLSYPALFMFMRGNLSAGYTGLCLAMYALTAVKGQCRWFGIVCLALAINIRPNTLVFGLLELVVARSNRERIISIVGIACLVTFIGWASLLVVHVYVPDYSLNKFMDGYRLYQKTYVEGDAGLEWNFSLFGTTQMLRNMLGVSPNYNANNYIMVDVIGVLASIMAIYLAMLRRLSVIDALYIASALSALFTPVFAFYHMTEFAVPLLAVLAVKGKATEVSKNHMLIFVTCLLCLCPLEAKRTLYPLLMFAVMIVVMVRAYEGGPILIPLTRQK